MRDGFDHLTTLILAQVCVLLNEDSKVAAVSVAGVVIAVVVTLLYLSAVWGLALNVSFAILNSLGMRAFVSAAYASAVVMASVGVSGLLLLIGLPFVGYFCLRRSGTPPVTMPWALRLSFKVVQGVERRATFAMG